MRPFLGRHLLRQSGFTLLETLIAIGITSIFAMMFSTLLSQFTSENGALLGDADSSGYREETKSLMRRLDMTAVNTPSMCVTRLAPKLNPTVMVDSNHLITDPLDTAGNIIKNNNKIKLGAINLLDPIKLTYGNLAVKDVYINNIRELTSRTAPRVASPGEIFLLGPNANFISGLQNVIYLVQADYNVELGIPQYPVGDRRNKTIKPLKLKFAVETTGAGATILDCGYGDVESTLTDIDVCKAFGPDFIYIFDNFDGANHGQCYAPEYDANLAKNFVADGNTVMNTPTGFTPLRGFFCEQASQGKSFLFNYCTGVN